MTKKVLFLCVIILPALKSNSEAVRDFTVKSGGFHHQRAILTADDDPDQYIEAREKCYQDHPVTPFHLAAKFAWGFENPTAECFLNCIVRSVSYMDESGEIKRDLIKAKVEKNTDGRVRELLIEHIDLCSEYAAKSANACKKSFDFLHCFYRSSMLTTLTQTLDLFKFVI